MTRYYAFNGDADGLCALQQLRLVEAQQATLVTGVKGESAYCDCDLAHEGNAPTISSLSSAMK